MRTALLVILILGASYHCATAMFCIPKECCFDYMTKPIHRSKLVNYYQTPSDCVLQAVVFETKSGHKICADPSKIWVKNGIKHLENKK